ncbi:hypothetical protein NKR23_g7100 [Pleurostoma richardsiae]|uniref:Uncharacterized protein n=1 Tax=Pleurostoma richardsiae TaxID=41990 RepID=A0AA38VNB8_9PEZI|nr:hypothetical protein NKR23_g7100 [Pleurostoma richardsiae]
MPCLRGIEISVVAESATKRLPEFPHPDGSHVHLREPEGVYDGNVQSSKRPDTSLGAEHDPTWIQKTKPRISVYIPSVPALGVQFSLRYAVTRPPEGASLFFFKMLMNGRHITSWGFKFSVNGIGSVVRALFEPSNRHLHKQNGVVLRRVGIESRHFYFRSGEANQSVAEEGGLIEVEVFRAKGRRRRAAKLDQFRDQEEYGICAPTAGLLDKPEDVTFYDFFLIDPKDSPYATFRFHYRSWENLEELNLIPQADLSLSSSVAGVVPHHGSAEDPESTWAQQAWDSKFSTNLEAIDEAVFDEDADYRSAVHRNYGLPPL